MLNYNPGSCFFKKQLPGIIDENILYEHKLYFHDAFTFYPFSTAVMAL